MSSDRTHTAAAATPQVVVSTLLQSAGVNKVDRLEELFDVSSLLVAAPLPTGNRVGLVGNSDGPLILAADGCETGGLHGPELAGPKQDALRRVVGASGAVGGGRRLHGASGPSTSRSRAAVPVPALIGRSRRRGN